MHSLSRFLYFLYSICHRNFHDGARLSKLYKFMFLSLGNARANMNISSEKHKKLYDIKSNPLKYKFKKGDLVWYFNEACKPGICPKLSQSWHGPYKVLRVISDILYQIQMNNNRVSVVHTDKLKLYLQTETTVNTEQVERDTSTCSQRPVVTQSGRNVRKPMWYGIPF